MKLIFYLFKESVKEFEQAVAAAKFCGDDAFQELIPKSELPFESKAYFQRNRKTKPKWLNFLTENFDIDPDDVFNTTNSFLLLIKVHGHIFAITQGFGFNGIDRNQLERGFGLRVALNEMDPKKLKVVDFRKIDTTTKQKRVLLNRNSPLYDFDFDVDEDLLNLIAGQASDPEFARKLVGADSLSLTGEVAFMEIGQRCDALLQAFSKEDYKEYFAFIDNLRQIKDKYLIQELEEALSEALSQRHTDKLMLAYPDIDNLNQIERFKLMYDYRADTCEEVDLESIYDFLNNYGFLGVAPKELGILGLDSDDNPITKKFSLHDHIVFETNHRGRKYLLTLGRWFEIANDYVEQVDRDISSIEEIADPDYLPRIRKGQREDEYNAFVATTREFLLLDKSAFPIGGRSKVEVSDLLSPQREFICVKKYNDSSTLSHLFSQGFVSAALFNDDKEYREFILGKYPDHWPKLFDEDSPDKAGISFVFAIASNSQGRLVDSLPFFSKVNLRRTRKDIERLGFRVKLYRIGYQGVPHHLPRLI